MEHNTIKLELIEWLAGLNDSETIDLLKSIKDSFGNGDWWDDLSEDQRKSIEKGISEIESGRYASHEDVKIKYGL
jgi:predicted transcriptional regulator